MLCTSSAKARSASLPAPPGSHDVRLWAPQHSKLGAVAAALEPEAAQLGIQVSKSGGGAGQEVQAEHLAVQLGREGTEQGYVSAEAVQNEGCSGKASTGKALQGGGTRRAGWGGEQPAVSARRGKARIRLQLVIRVVWRPGGLPRPLHSRLIIRRETLQLLRLVAGSLVLQAAAGAGPVLLGGNDVV